jgi:hypothetical protein
MNRFWLSQGAHTAWDSNAETPHTSLEILLITGTFWGHMKLELEHILRSILSTLTHWLMILLLNASAGEGGGDTLCIYALGGSFISLRKKEKLGLYFISVGMWYNGFDIFILNC